jgi:hypothetical protein
MMGQAESLELGSATMVPGISNLPLLLEQSSIALINDSQHTNGLLNATSGSVQQEPSSALGQ